MDVLSTVLKTVKLEGAMFYNAEFSAPWSFRSPPSCLVAPYVSPKPRHVIIYNITYSRMDGLMRMSRTGSDLRSLPGTLLSFPTAIPTSWETVAMSSRRTLPKSFTRSSRRVSSWRAWGHPLLRQMVHVGGPWPGPVYSAVLSLRHDAPPRSAESYTLSCGLRGAGQSGPRCGPPFYFRP